MERPGLKKLLEDIAAGKIDGFELQDYSVAWKGPTG
jgi:hypothetical protein